jgi:hypothetical protein
MSILRKSPAMYLMSPYVAIEDTTSGLSGKRFLLKIPIYPTKVTDAYSSEQTINDTVISGTAEATPSTIRVALGRASKTYEVSGYIKKYGVFSSFELRCILNRICELDQTVRVYYDLFQWESRTADWGVGAPANQNYLMSDLTARRVLLTGTNPTYNWTPSAGSSVSEETFNTTVGSAIISNWAPMTIQKFSIDDQPEEDVNDPDKNFTVNLSLKLTPEQLGKAGGKFNLYQFTAGHANPPVLTAPVDPTVSP